MTIITIIGPDGSGKSTIADLLVIQFEKRGYKSKHYAQRFGVIPKLSIFKRIFKSVNKNYRSDKKLSSSEQYDLRQNHIIKSLIYISWYAFDYFLGGVFLKAKNQFSRRKHIAIFARYYYDYYYQSNNRALSIKIKKLIAMIVPMPKYIFFIDRDAHDIYEGKPELPIKEIMFQQKLIIDNLKQFQQFYKINGRMGADSTLSEIMSIIDSENTFNE